MTVQQAQNAAQIVTSLGVNTHLSWTSTPYSNLPQVASELNYLGLHNIRDDVANTTQEFNALSALAAQGYKVDMLANTSLSGFLSLTHNLEAAYPGSVLAIEGLNEVDGWSPSYAGLTGETAAIQYQKDLYASVKGDALLNHVPVYNLTVSAVTSTSDLGDLSPYVDDANVHLYYGAGQPAYGWSPYDSTYWWTSWLASGRLDAPGRPIVVTESGSSATPAWGGGVDENTQARQILNSFMDAAKTGVSATYIYELVDGTNNGPTDPGSHYGLFRWDGSARLAAAAVHNFTQILMDGTPLTGAPGSLDYTVQGVPQWGGQMLFQEGDGTQDIIVWAEPDIWNETTKTAIAPPNTPITIDLATAANVSIYDPIQGSAPVLSLGLTSHVAFNVTDHPLIIEVKPASGASAPPPAPTGLADAAIIGGYVNAAHDTDSQTLTGSAMAGVTVTVYDSGTQLGAATASSSGQWSYTLGRLADGAHALTATATDADGDTGPASSALQFIVDTQAPAPRVSNVIYSSSTKLAALTGSSEAGSVVKIYDNGALLGTVTANGSGAWSLSARVGSAVDSFTEQATDPAGNPGASSGVALSNRSGSVNLIGGSGDDVLVGRGGDALTGGAGSDTFVFNQKFGLERVTDFNPTTDVIAVDHRLFSSFTSVLQHATQSGTSTLITYDRTDVITLQNTTVSSLAPGDFVFF